MQRELFQEVVTLSVFHWRLILGTFAFIAKIWAYNLLYAGIVAVLLWIFGHVFGVGFLEYPFEVLYLWVYVSMGILFSVGEILYSYTLTLMVERLQKLWSISESDIWEALLDHDLLSDENEGVSSWTAQKFRTWLRVKRSQNTRGEK